jgi:CHAT domain-containing protein
MDRAELAAHLVAASSAERSALLKEHSALADLELAYALKDICYEAFTIEPARSVQAAAALADLAHQNQSEEIDALAEWVAAIASLVQGLMEQAVAHLENAEKKLLDLGKELTAATTQLSKVLALAMLGRYDEAIAIGLAALQVFLDHGDLLSAGRLENNVGNLYFRQEHYLEAEQFQSRARERFLALQVDHKQLAIINNCLANTYAILHKFKAAEELYAQAEQQAELAGLPVTLAEIEGNIGSFALLQGKYDRALDYLERSRRRYASLEMPHQSLIAEQEIADAYLELNLIPEATEIYERIIPRFASLGLRAEQARAAAQLGRALLQPGRIDDAKLRLREARELYEAEENEVGAAMVALSQAQLFYQQGDAPTAGELAAQVEAPLARSGSWRRILMARWILAEAQRWQGLFNEADSILRQTLRDAVENEQPQVAERCFTSLGLIAVSRGERHSAEEAFKQAIALIEQLRAPLPGDEFRTSFFSDKLTSYSELVRLLIDGDGRVAEAFTYVERARARSLADVMEGEAAALADPRDAFEVDLTERLAELRQELNYLYNQLNRPLRLSNQEKESLRTGLRQRERQTAELLRQLQHRRSGSLASPATLDVDQLQLDLGSDTALLEYTALGEQLTAFLVTDRKTEVVRSIGNSSDITAELVQLRFQLDTLRHGSERIRRHLPDLTERTKRHMRRLYDCVMPGIEDRIGGRRLVIVPQGALHYLPFQALCSGDKYMIERREVSYAPSARVFQQCLHRSRAELNKALLMGVADERIPSVRNEIKSLLSLFPSSVALLDGEATLSAFRREVEGVDLIHMACHGQFRPDNPLFSSLQLGDGWLTVRDAYNLHLNCQLVTLSACETGVNNVSPGEELIGLARGFFAAGAPALLMSLWTVDDEATCEMMTDFYQALRKVGSASRALREAQLNMLKARPHPFFWSPFVLIGRW